MGAVKRVLFIATGGTIACCQGENGLSPEYGAAELLSRIPVLPCEVKFIHPFSLDSTNMSPENWIQIAGLIKENYNNYDGFVISHGTDTMSYAAAALSCLIRNSGKPIILTGSQRTMNENNSDAPKNLYDAFTCACSDALKGIFVVFFGRIIDGKRARKIHTHDFDAFRSVDFPDIGSVSNGTVTVEVAEKNPDENVVFYDKMDTSVVVVKLIPGEPSSVFSVCKNCGAVIIEGYGTGGLPDMYEKNIAELTRLGVYIVMTTQVPLGGSELERYSVGAEAMRKYDLIEASGMTAETASMKTMWALAYSSSKKEFKKLLLK